jgi:putative membrane protein
MQLTLRPVYFGSAAAILLAVLLPPLATAGRAVFAAHMLQHLLLIVIAAPLLALAWPHRPPPVYAWLAFVAIFLLWHWPIAFRWADRTAITRLIEFASILAAATIFWMAAFHVLAPGAAALYVVTAALATDFPGVIMIFAPTAICTMPGERAAAWHLTPLADQQLAGLLMWVPANLIFFSIAIALIARWFSVPSQKLVAT